MVLKVRGDSVVFVLTLELALDGSCVPIVAEHVSGVANELTDQLSWKNQPGPMTSNLRARKFVVKLKVLESTPTHYLALRMLV